MKKHAKWLAVLSALSLAFVVVLTCAQASADTTGYELIETLSVSATNPNPVSMSTPLQTGSEYRVEASGTYNYSSGSNQADAAYATNDGWSSLRTDIGIHPTTAEPTVGIPSPGVTSLLVDFGGGMRIADWGAYRADHVYTYEFTASSGSLGFVISDWWENWYGSPWDYQKGMSDNSGSLTVRIYRKNSATSGLVAYYPFNGNANDESGNGNNGAAHGATLTEDRFGNPNSAYSFNGVDNYIGIMNSPTLEMGYSDYTIAAWIKTTATANNGRIFSKGSSGCLTGYMMRMGGPESAYVHLENAYNGGCPTFFYGNNPVNDGKWHFVTGVVKRSSEARIYVDGVLDNSRSLDTSSLNLDNGRNPTIGSNDVGNAVEYFNGAIDDLRIYKRALTDSEIVALTVEQQGLTGYWPFEDGADYSGNGRDLVLAGNAGLSTGLVGQALELRNDGSQYAARTADDAVYDFGSNDFTVQVWVNFNNTSREQTLIEKFYGGGGPGWTLTKLDGNVLHFWANPSAVFYSPVVQIQTGVWHQFIARKSGSLFQIIYDGNVVAQASSSVAVPDTTMPLLIGKRNASDGRNFAVDGRIDEAAIWSRALTDAEIAYLYNNGSGNSVTRIGLSPAENRSPVANAGPDQVVSCAGTGGSTVTLDGSGSGDPDGDSLTYNWTWAGGSAEGANPTVTLPFGTTTATLTVADGRGGTSSDTVEVTVADTSAPLMTTSIDGTIGANNKYVSNVKITLTASDGCSGVKEIHYTINGAESVVSAGSVELVLSEDGDYAIGYWAVDNAGLAGQAGSLQISRSMRLRNPWNGHEYERFDTSMTWHGAKSFCESKGGHLATLTSQEENDFVYTNLAVPSPYIPWIGATDEAAEGVWTWVTGEPWEYTKWYPGEPNNAGGMEHYAHFTAGANSWVGNVNGWNDLPDQAWLTTSTICEWDNQQAWILASEFRLSPNQANPNPDNMGNTDIWYFMQSGSLVHDPATYSLLPNFFPDALYVPGLQAWQGSVISSGDKGKLPMIGINATGVFQHVLTLSWPAGAIMMHPLPDQLAVVGWRSPVTGTISITGSFADIDGVCGDGIVWSIDKGAATLANGSFPNGGAQNFAAGSNGASLAGVSVNQGDFIYFIVDPNNGHGCDSTGLDVTITLLEKTCNQPPSGMIGWWPGDGNANDIAGQNNGTLTGGTTYTTGLVGQAFSFAAPGDMVQIAHDPSLNLESLPGASFEGWFKSSGGSAYGDAIIISKHTCGTMGGWFFTTDQGCQIGDHFIGGYGVGNVSDLDDGKFHHFACVKDGTTYREYIDGALISQDTGPAFGTPVTEPVQIGSITTGYCYSAKHQIYGSIDELGIFGRALSDQEVRAIYSAGGAGKCKGPVDYMLVVPNTIPGNNPANLTPVLRYRFTDTGPLTQLSSIPPYPETLIKDPSYAVFSAKGELFIANRQGNVGGGEGSIARFIIDNDLNYIANGSVTGNYLEAVHGVAFSPSGELFAANVMNGRISRFKFDAVGNAIPNGTIETGLSSQIGVAFSPSGELFVSNYYVIKRYLFNADGIARDNGSFSIPGASLIHGLAFNSAGELFITSADTSLVYRFLFDGNNQPVANGTISAPGGPVGVVFSQSGELFVSCHLSGAIYRFLFENGNAVSNGVISTPQLGGAAILALRNLPAATDSDGDGYTTATDCNDNDPLQHPGQIWYKDSDNDGYSDGTTVTQCARPADYKAASELIATSGDCNDSDPLDHPGQVWHKDADNDGYSDGSVLTQCSRPAGYKLAGELTAVSGDCNDNNITINPGATEVAFNGIDENCNGIQDDANTVVYNPANGHWYTAVAAAGNWDAANAAAQLMTFQGITGHLATLTSAQENSFVATNLPAAAAARYWLGGYQDRSATDYSEPAGGWRWVTGEPWAYTNWTSGEPNDSGPEDFLLFSVDGSWNDGKAYDYDRPGYVVEFDSPDSPSQSARVDLALEWGDISFWQNGVEVTNPGELDSIVIKARIHNLSSDTASSAGSVSFYDTYVTGNRSQVLLGTATLPAIAPNADVMVELPWTPDPQDPQPDFHVIQVSVAKDPAETYIDNNSATHHIVRGTRQAAGNVNIDIKYLSVSSQQQMTVGARFTLSGQAQYHWQNGYYLPVLGGKVTLRLGDQTYETRTGSTGWFYQEVVMPLTPACYSLSIEVSDATISGQAQLSLCAVSPPPATGPDLAVYNIYLANGVADMPETVYAYIANQGGDTASGSFTNHIEITGPSGQPVFTDTTTYENAGGLAAGSGVTISFTGWKPSAAGNYRITVSTDYNNAVSESNEGNNTTTVIQYVYPHSADIEAAELRQSCNAISVRIANHGGLASQPGTLRITDGVTERTVTLSSIPGKNDYGVWIDGGAYTGNQTNTVITATAVVPEDSNPDNNTRSGIFDFTSKSDLTISNLRVNGQSWGGANTVYQLVPNTVEAELRNLGCIGAAGTIQFYLDGNPLGEPVAFSEISGGATAAVSIEDNFANSTAGTNYTLSATVSVSQGYTDAVPGNNTYAERLIVSPQLPDYRVYSEDIHFSSDPGHPAKDDKIVITADIHNVGLAEGNRFTVAFYEEGQTLIGVVQTFEKDAGEGIQPGKSLAFSPRDANNNVVEWSNGYSGNHAIMVVVAPVVGVENDPNDADNSATRKVWVNYPPQARIAATATTTNRPNDTVSFSAAGSNDNLDIDGKGGIVRYDWNFGDGQAVPDAGPDVTHIYPAGGGVHRNRNSNRQ